MTDCHVCLSMRTRKPSHVQEGLSKTCILCCRLYCPNHAATNGPANDNNVCEINHQTYYRNHRQQSKADIFPSLSARAEFYGTELDVAGGREKGAEKYREATNK
ncbi:hypothetical protein VFPPC_17750 [Pochonia chlamydosporia 170]|uniref:Uncharacterized protein n=1 Tax=Pochonia chlamydosporia 170 TaxID=1380566 RepID=A0A219AS13_METCM|nr:hypothetical protein VFPPC_17750 [Pochonia chlamydosporia 170]OWT43074.1 hypothetical protein VFPPC_17750 [Pochonia chlamydosporia 170]